MRKNKASIKASPKSFRVYFINFLIFVATVPEFLLLVIVATLFLWEVACGY